MEIDLAWIEKNIIKTELTAEQKQKLTDIVKPVAVSKGDVIVSEGENGGVMYLVRSGSVNVFKDMDGAEHRVAGMGELAMIGEVTFLSGEAATATVVAAEDSVVYAIDRDGFSGLMQTSHELVFALFTFMLLYESSVIRELKEDHIKLMTFMSGSHK